MRPRKTDRHLPKCVYRKHGAYYLVKRGKWEPLGSNLVDALAEYARRHTAPTGSIDRHIDEAMIAITARVAPTTKSQYGKCSRTLKRMLRQFSSPDQIKPKHAAQIKQLLSKTPNMANRVLSVFRSICAVWLEQQIIEANPALGIKPHPEKKRRRLISMEEFDAIRDKAGPRLQCLMDLWRLTGQRVADVINIRCADLRTDGIYFRQDKTDAELIVRWNPDLKAAVDRAKGLSGNVRALTLFHTRKGAPPSRTTVEKQWQAACKAAGITDAQARDIRAMAATETRRQGKDATALLGHKNKGMTERYLRDREIPLVDGPSIGQVLDIGQKDASNQ